MFKRKSAKVFAFIASFTGTYNVLIEDVQAFLVKKLISISTIRARKSAKGARLAHLGLCFVMFSYVLTSHNYLSKITLQ